MLKHWKLISFNLLALALGGYLALYGFNLPGKRLNAEQIEGLFWPNQKQLGSFELIEHSGSPFTLESLDKAWNLLFFGYTYCPDICPITMTALRETAELLASSDQPDSTVRMVFISVDGERDVTDHLANYINYYGEAFSAASGSKQQVDSLAGQLGVPYEIEPHEPGDNYLVSHSGALFLLSPEAKLYAIIQPPHDPTELAERLLTIRQFIRQED